MYAVLKSERVIQIICLYKYVNLEKFKHRDKLTCIRFKYQVSSNINMYTVKNVIPVRFYSCIKKKSRNDWDEEYFFIACVRIVE